MGSNEDLRRELGFRDALTIGVGGREAAGRGIPMLAEGAGDVTLDLRGREEYPSGIVSLRYHVVG